MAKLGIVHCRICKRDIDRNIEKEGIDWIMPSPRQYYHKKCYDDWKNNDNLETVKEWKKRLYSFLSQDLKVEYNYQQCEAQIDKLLKQGKTMKSIYHAAVYYFDVRGNSWEKKYGFGIIPNIYNEAQDYWLKVNRDNSELIKIYQEEKEARKKNTVIIQRQDIPIKRKRIDLSTIKEEE